MSRDYKNHKQKKPEPLVSRFGHALSFLTGLALGLFVAVIIYFQQHGENVVTRNVLLTENEIPVTDLVDNNTDDKVAQLPEPQFDFYKILPNKEVNISEWESVEEESDEQATEQQQPAMYVLQVGSFKEFQAADEIKARLALMGVTADIQRVVINGQDVRHRVRIGPYKNSSQLQQAKDRLLANDLDFMLLKLKMEDI